MRISDWSSDVCSSDLEHQVADCRPLDEHRVEALAHGCERVVDRDHRRVHPDADLTCGGLVGHGEQLDDEAHPLGEVDVDVGEAGDALVVDIGCGDRCAEGDARSEEHTSELQSLMRISYAVFCLKKKKTT